MSPSRIAVLPGDGIGPEVVRAALDVVAAAARRFHLDLVFTVHSIGGAAVAAHGDPFPAATREAVLGADAVLLGAVGDPSLDAVPRHLKPETGLLALRAALGVYANLRPVAIHPAL
ncbi:MAG: isocitrate/isopropylmalate family dehydrogenase, partial [Gemmatimonadota bacterium]|nr:isocitrate/isopropylmalate family dehydrogenase [Gemmatimonadota bacterium]